MLLSIVFVPFLSNEIYKSYKNNLIVLTDLLVEDFNGLYR